MQHLIAFANTGNIQVCFQTIMMTPVLVCFFFFPSLPRSTQRYKNRYLKQALAWANDANDPFSFSYSIITLEISNCNNAGIRHNEQLQQTITQIPCFMCWFSCVIKAQVEFSSLIYFYCSVVRRNVYTLDFFKRCYLLSPLIVFRWNFLGNLIQTTSTDAL